MKFIYSLLFSVLFFFSVRAQLNDRGNTNLDRLVFEYNNLYDSSQKLVDEIYQRSNTTHVNLFYDFLEDKNFNSEESFSKPLFFTNQNSYDIGLKWITDYNHNFGFGNSDEDDIFYRSKVSTGIDWVIFGEGSLEKNKRENLINKLEYKKDSLEMFLINNSYESKVKFEILKKIFDYNRLEILKRYSEFYKMKVFYTEKLYNEGLINYAEKLKNSHFYQKIINHIELLESDLSSEITKEYIKNYSQMVYSEVDFQTYFDMSLVGFKNINSEILELQRELLEKQFNNSDKINFRTKFRYNFYNSEGIIQRNFASIGASLTVPIKFEKKSKTTYLNQLKNINSKIQTQIKSNSEQLSSLFYSFKSLQNDLSELKNQSEYLKALLDNEKEIFNKHKRNFSPEKSIEYSISLVQNQLRILEVKQKLFECFVSYYYLLKTKTKTKKSNPIATYLWSDTFNSYSNSSLIQLLRENKINNLLFSATNIKDNEKFLDFIVQAKNNNINISRLISENSFSIDESGILKLLDKLKQIDISLYSGIHLNIEPHTFDDYKENKLQYITNMNLIYEKAYDWCKANNLEFSVSIPMHLPRENVDFLTNLEVKIYVMAYDNIDQKKLLNRTYELRKKIKNQLVWVLKVKDFQDEFTLDKAINTLEENGINNIGLYDVSSLIKRKYNEN